MVSMTRFRWCRQQFTKMLVLPALLFVPALQMALSTNAAEISGPAPDFTLKSAQHGNLRLQEYRGQVVLLNFWASWCGPCRKEMPALQDLYKKYEKFGFVVLAVSVDEDTSAADEFMGTVEVDFPYLYDTESKVSELYAVEAMPTTVVIDRDGQRRFLHKGYQPGFEEKYRKNVKQLIRE